MFWPCGTFITLLFKIKFIVHMQLSSYDRHEEEPSPDECLLLNTEGMETVVDIVGDECK